MTAVLLVVVGLLLIGEFLLFGALAEAYRDISQLRSDTGAIDHPAPVEIGAARGATPSAFGLPAQLDIVARALVLFVDSRCGTCRAILTSLDGGTPQGVWISVFDETHEAALQWLSSAGFDLDRPLPDRIRLFSSGEDIPLGVTITPLAVEIENGQIVRARTVPSVRQFYAMVPSTFALTPEREPEEMSA